MKKFNIRLFGRGAWGKCEVSFDQDPTVKMVEDKVAQCLKSGVLRLQIIFELTLGYFSRKALIRLRFLYLSLSINLKIVLLISYLIPFILLP